MVLLKRFRSYLLLCYCSLIAAFSLSSTCYHVVFFFVLSSVLLQHLIWNHLITTFDLLSTSYNVVLSLSYYGTLFLWGRFRQEKHIRSAENIKLWLSMLGLELVLSSSPVFHKKRSTLKFKFDEDLKV